MIATDKLRLSDAPAAVFPEAGGDRVFDKPVEVVVARRLDEVLPAVKRIEERVGHGLHAAGYIAYEAAPAFDKALSVHPPSELPLLWFGLFDDVRLVPAAANHPGEYELGAWSALVDEEEYRRAIAEVHERIAAGDTYQVNYTFPLRASFQGDAYAFFRALCSAQGDGHYGYLDTGRFKILSASPELFFSLDGSRLETKPMKGTRPRGRWVEEDRGLSQELLSSAKERAENIMIVDLLRNDMGRISDTGSVEVPRFFDVERYETVWQMTSTVTSRTQVSWPDILLALFPSGSVTGAPKIETMKIINHLEPHPRGVYCGAVGWYGPGRQAKFNVAIRTVTVDTENSEAWYPVGSGVTWDSDAGGEYDECWHKAAVLGHKRPEFNLLESLLHDGDYFLLDGHLRRLAESAAHFGYPLDEDGLRHALEEHGHSLGSRPSKVRVLLSRDGTYQIENAPAPAPAPVRAALATSPIDKKDIFLYHKTTNRAVYERARAQRPDCDDVLLWNKSGELTESTVANVVLEFDGGRWTPPVACGLLGGTFRQHLLAAGEIQERRLTKQDLERAEKVYLVNSVRKWIPVTVVS